MGFLPVQHVADGRSGSHGHLPIQVARFAWGSGVRGRILRHHDNRIQHFRRSPSADRGGFDSVVECQNASESVEEFLVPARSGILGI